MNRHYGVNTIGGIFASRFYCDNQQWYRCFKSDKQLHDAGAMSYFFNEVRQERIDIFLEAARKGADGLLVGCCRQVPMLLYNPQMVAAYQKETGIDPRTIDGSNLDQYTKWITWRADYFTQFLRDLKKGLDPIRNQSNKRIPIAVRIPSAGLLYNLAQGLDVRQWLREGLVDQLHLDPLDDLSGRGSHDVRPYIEMGQKYGVPIIGGIGGTWAWSPDGYVTTLSRALGLLESGVDGIEIFETEVQAKCNEYRWLLPVFGNAEKIRNFLAESNLESCYPISAENAMIGYDNHSKWMPSGGNWTIYGYGKKSL
jgi:hypothetical protein